MNAERYRKIIYWMLPVLGVLFCLWYVKNATCDVVYSDYIRLNITAMRRANQPQPIRLSLQ